MIAFIGDHRQAYGVEPICRALPIAPSTYHAHAATRSDPSRLPERVRRDADLKVEIRRVFEENFRVYGVRKVWRQLRREPSSGWTGSTVAGFWSPSASSRRPRPRNATSPCRTTQTWLRDFKQNGLRLSRSGSNRSKWDWLSFGPGLLPQPNSRSGELSVCVMRRTSGFALSLDQRTLQRTARSYACARHRGPAVTTPLAVTTSIKVDLVSMFKDVAG